MKSIQIPYYYKSINYDEFVKEYAPPAEFAETVYLWTRDKIEKMQNERFKKTVKRGWAHPLYKKKWTEAGLTPSDIKGIKDIVKLPILSTLDLKSEIQLSPPFGASGNAKEVVKKVPLKLNSTGGTTGMPRPIFFSPIEWEMNQLQFARAYFTQGARPGDMMQIPVTPSIANLAWAAYGACHHWLGVVAVTTGTGNVTPSRRQIELAREWGTNLWVSFPEYMGHLAKVAQEELNFDVRDLKTKFIQTFLGPDLSGRLRKQLEEIWGTDVYDAYGTTDISLASFECKEKAGRHFQEDLMYVEVVDADTNQPVDMKKGEKGDLVVTCFYRHYPPIIRYSLKDLVRIIDYGKKCACGSYLLRMDYFLGRSDDMVKIRGLNVYPMACLDAVTIDARSTGEWICVVDRIGEGLNATEEMTVKVEYKNENIDKVDFKKKMEESLKNDLGLRVKVEPVPAGSLSELTGYGGETKVKRLKDNRPTER
jgi:phenylacetate-CoA ligase